MKPIILFVFVSGLVIVSGCKDQDKKSGKAKAAEEAKARADAAKKEMETLPKAFNNPDYFKKNEPVPASNDKGKSTDSAKKT